MQGVSFQNSKTSKFVGKSTSPLSIGINKSTGGNFATSATSATGYGFKK